MLQNLLESADAGRLLGVTPAEIRRLARQGVLPVASVTPRGTRLFARDVVERLAAERQRRTDNSNRRRRAEDPECPSAHDLA